MESGFLTRTNSESKELTTRFSRPKSFQTVLSFRNRFSSSKVHEMAGSISSPCAGQKSSRPSLCVNTTFSPTAAPGLTHSQVSDIWNSHVESLCSLMTNGPPETRWIALSPAVNSSGEQSFTRTTREALTRIMGDDATLVFAQTPHTSPSDSLMGMVVDEEESVAGYVFGMGGMGGDIAPNNYQFGLSTPSEPASSPMAQHIEFANTAMDEESEQEGEFNSDLSPYAFGQITDTRTSMLARSEQAIDIDSNAVQEYVFGQGGMGLDFATLSDQMVDHYNGDYVIHMARETSSSAARRNQGAPTATTQPSVTNTAIQPSTGSQNQVSSSMPPPPLPTTTTTQPAVTGILVQPYRLPANAPPADPNATAFDLQLLTNSGVNVMTDYPLSTSPRMSTRAANRCLDSQGDAFWHSRPNPMRSGDSVGHLWGDVKVNPVSNFQPFSWDSTSQPRTEAARRAEGSDDNLSPSSKKSNKRKRSQLLKM
jgi:hypothetical protein